MTYLPRERGAWTRTLVVRTRWAATARPWTAGRSATPITEKWRCAAPSCVPPTEGESQHGAEAIVRDAKRALTQAGELRSPLPTLGAAKAVQQAAAADREEVSA